MGQKIQKGAKMRRYYEGGRGQQVGGWGMVTSYMDAPCDRDEKGS